MMHKCGCKSCKKCGCGNKPDPEQKTVRCTDCHAEFTNSEISSVSACPKCNTASLPMAIEDDVTLPINWHELRILTMWASNWAERFDEKSEHSKITLHKIIRRLEKYRPKNAEALTLVAEIKELQEFFPGVELIGEDGETIVPPKEE